MRNHLLILLAFGLALSSCSSGLHGIFDKKTPHEQYADKLDDKGLEKTPAGQAWLAASKAALDQPVTVKLPYQQQGYFPSDKSRALGLLFSAHRGERLTFTLEKNTGERLPLYADLFQQTASAPNQLHAADTAESAFSVDIEETGNYILRLQPQLYDGGRYQLSVSVGPSLGYPVSGNKTRAGSFWGDDRDGGKRLHEGVDLFAPKRTPVIAAADGYVTGVREGGLGGKVVWLRPAGKNYTLYYAHLDEQSVQEGQEVKKGDVLGLVGNTGNAQNTPSHLHFGIYTNAGAVNPYPFIDPAVKTAAPAPRKDLTATLRVTATRKNTGTDALKANTLLVPLAVSTQGYIAELPGGGLILAPITAVQPVKNAATSKDKPA